MSAEFAILLAEMQADFLDELPERCNRIEAGVMALERGTPGSFDELYRQVHSLKGSGGMFTMPVITTICHQFESFISEVHARFDRTACTAALAYVDLLRKSPATRGGDAAATQAIEQSLERLRESSLSGRASVLVIEPSEAMRKLYAQALAGKPVQLIGMDSALQALERLLHEPFDLLIASREQGDLNAVALLAALRDSGCGNKDIPAILVSSNSAPAPTRLGVRAVVPRDAKLLPMLARQVDEALATRSARNKKGQEKK